MNETLLVAVFTGSLFGFSGPCLIKTQLHYDVDNEIILIFDTNKTGA